MNLSWLVNCTNTICNWERDSTFPEYGSFLTKPDPRPTLPPKVLWRKVFLPSFQQKINTAHWRRRWRVKTSSSPEWVNTTSVLREGTAGNCRLWDRLQIKPFQEQRVARPTLSPEAGTAEPLASYNFISLRLQFSMCLQNWITCHWRSCYPADLFFTHRFARLPNQSTGREGEAKLSPSHCVLGLSFISNHPPLPQLEKIVGLEASVNRSFAWVLCSPAFTTFWER